MTAAEIRARMAKLETVHEHEIGCRAGELLAILRQLLAAIDGWTPAAELPDSDTTVLGTNPKWDEPVWPCFHDGEHWRDVDGMALLGSWAPVAWRHFPEPQAV